jgi:hypothetical protein
LAAEVDADHAASPRRNVGSLSFPTRPCNWKFQKAKQYQKVGSMFWRVLIFPQIPLDGDVFQISWLTPGQPI